jgi:hypothetical protein
MRFDELLAAKPKDGAWIEGVEAQVESHATHFFGRASSVRMRLDAAAAFRDAAAARIEAKDAAGGRALLDAAKRNADDPAALLPLEEQLVALESRADELAAQARRVEAAKRVDAALLRMTATACTALEIDGLAKEVTTLKRSHAAEGARIDAAVAGYAADCVRAVGRLDYERAVAMRRDAERALGQSAALAAVDLDPCGVDELAGNGASVRRTGFCVDTLDDGSLGPRLVVVPVDGGRIAVAKYEASWNLLAPFCTASGSCKVREDEAPVLDVDVDLARAFAAWLSERTGEAYRLPTLTEWRTFAAAGEPDPNRNCGRRGFPLFGRKPTVDVRAGAENAFGVVNALGNVREWAVEGDGLVAAGGSFRDRPAECIADTTAPHTGKGDAATGFRLVRTVR